MKKIILTLVIICLLITGGVLAGKSISANSAGSACDWRMYNNSDQLIDAASLIVKGSIEKVYPSEDIVIGEAVNAETGEMKAIKSLYTVVDVRVIKVYKGNVKEGDIIQVKQWGGIDKDKHFAVRDVEYYKPNEKRFFFLETYDDGTPASPLNGLQGDFKITNGKIKLRDPNKLFDGVVDENGMDTIIDTTVKKLVK